MLVEKTLWAGSWNAWGSPAGWNAADVVCIDGCEANSINKSSSEWVSFLLIDVLAELGKEFDQQLLLTFGVVDVNLGLLLLHRKSHLTFYSMLCLLLAVVVAFAQSLDLHRFRAPHNNHWKAQVFQSSCFVEKRCVDQHDVFFMVNIGHDLLQDLEANVLAHLPS